ncbi:MAG: hypothetical protein OXN89_16465 [Bryobacterales bacterium]|nr:hypothetical protein [Bryobacterales bacterium]
MVRKALVVATMLGLGACSVPAPPAGEHFEVIDGLEMTVWASEPLVVNPTNFDIDERGRIWFVESVNYRTDLKGQPRNDLEGDRIVILEDTNGHGRADSRKLFDQHPEMLAPLGISVLGNKVLVSQSPDLIVYTKDEDDNIVGKETLLTGWRGIDHDHGLHVVLFGHDGRYYFNSGDQGFEVTDRSGNTFRSSREGPYFAATVQSVNPDGTDFRVLAHNARNPYEIAIDSFGSIWQTDNDDDGNQWTRLLHVMEGANFGYWGPGGRRWREDKGTHFHEERPDTVPYIARTGPGSPTGLVVYEGDLLPARYQGQLLHSEPGKRLIQGFHLQPDGAGFSLDTENTVVSTDPLFRPSDIAVAPDGSVFVADWRDPVVGGHNMLDRQQGRIYRIAPPGHLGDVPPLDLESPGGLLAAFASPNQATRYRAYQELRLRSEDERLGLLRTGWEGPSYALRARSLWLLGGMGQHGAQAVEAALASQDPRFRILGLRVARLHGLDLAGKAAHLAHDPSPQVRREVALVLPHVSRAARLEIWLALAEEVPENDRWYLAALGIGASGIEDDLYAALSAGRRGLTPQLAALYRILQAPSSLGQLSAIALDSTRSPTERMGALDVVGWQAEPQASRTVATIAGSNGEPLELRNRALYFMSKQLFSEWRERRDDTHVVAGIGRALDSPGTRTAALRVAELSPHLALAPRLMRLASSKVAAEEHRVTALRTLGALGGQEVESMLHRQAAAGPDTVRIAAMEGLRLSAADGWQETLVDVLLSDAPNAVRTAALRTLGTVRQGQLRILDMEESFELPGELRAAAASMLNRSRDRDVRARAAKVLPGIASAGEQRPIRPREILESVGSPDRGRAVFERKDGASCAKCHSLTPGEELVGPSLATIAAKYGKEGLLDAILHPSAGIAPEYVTWILDTTTHGTVTGLMVEDGPERIVLRTEAAEDITLAPEDVLDRRQGSLSLMPDDLASAVPMQELIDLIAFLATLETEDIQAAGS